MLNLCCASFRSLLVLLVLLLLLLLLLVTYSCLVVYLPSYLLSYQSLVELLLHIVK